MITPTSGITGQVKLIGKSTDSKPTSGITNGSSFYELDTGDFYFFDGATSAWVLQ